MKDRNRNSPPSPQIPLYSRDIILHKYLRKRREKTHQNITQVFWLLYHPVDGLGLLNEVLRGHCWCFCGDTRGARWYLGLVYLCLPLGVWWYTWGQVVPEVGVPLCV